MALNGSQRCVYSAVQYFGGPFDGPPKYYKKYCFAASRYVFFSFFSSEHPVVTEVKGIILEQNDKAMMKRELLLLCNTANRHPLKYAWFKDDEPLIKGQDSIKVSLQDDETKYTCQVSNIAGSASRSLVISLMGGPGEKIDSFFSNLYQK